MLEFFYCAESQKDLCNIPMFSLGIDGKRFNILYIVYVIINRDLVYLWLLYNCCVNLYTLNVKFSNANHPGDCVFSIFDMVHHSHSFSV